MAYEELFNKWYGVEWDASQSSPELTRIAEDMDCHKVGNLPVHNAMKACLLKDNGRVNYYLDPTDWSLKVGGGSSDLTGGDGQVMIMIPAHYEKFETDGSIYRIKVSMVYKAGFRYHPKIYISAYKAALDRTNLKLSSVKSTAAQYRGGNNNASLDGTDTTQIQKPATAISLTNFRTYARSRGVNWSCYNYMAWKKLFWLFAIEFATLNSQKAVDATTTAEGYAKGGLGDGVTTVNSSDWSTFNSYYPLIPCGTSDSLASGSGEVSYSISSFPGATGTVNVNRYRGIENPFGDIWEWCDGINFHFLETQQTAKAYIIDNPNKFVDDGDCIARARASFDVSKVNGYIKDIVFGVNGDIIASEVGGSNVTYIPDYFYSGYAGGYWGWRALLVGGYAHIGTYAGLGFSSSRNAASITNAYLGSRLCFFGG